MKIPIVLLFFGVAMGILSVYEFSRLVLSTMEERLFAVVLLVLFSYACFAASIISSVSQRVRRIEKLLPTTSEPHE
jgi:hypothetical protein